MVYLVHMQQPTTTEGNTMETTLVYGSPAAKARIKELKGIEADTTAQLKAANDRMRAYEDEQRAANPDYRSWQDDSDTRKALAAEQDALRTAYYAARNERLEAQTCPLPCEPRQLPATYVPGNSGDIDHLAPAPTDPAAYTAGDIVTVYSRGGWRQAVVVEARKTNMEVAYTTQGTIAEAMRHGRGPNGVTVTRKIVKLTEAWGHVPQAPAADLQTSDQPATVHMHDAAPTNPKEDGTMAAQQDTPAPVQALDAPGKVPARTAEQKKAADRIRKANKDSKLEATQGTDGILRLTDGKAIFIQVAPDGTDTPDPATGSSYHEPAALQYLKARADGDTATMASTKEQYTLHRRFYGQDLEARRASGQLKRKPKAASA
jgi:hypothetical protein